MADPQNILVDFNIPTVDVRIQAGIPGPAGASSGIFTYAAGEAIGGHRLVRLDGLVAYYADPADTAHAGHCIGMTTNAAALGGLLTIIGDGEIEEPSWTFTPGALLYLGASGLPTETSPTSGYSQNIGFALTATKLFIQLGKPILKA